MKNNEIYYLGGSPCSGKSTISELLSTRQSMRLHKCDDHLDRFIKIGTENNIQVMKNINNMTMDEIWLRDVDEQVEEEFEFYRYALSIVDRDLQKLPNDKGIITEGAILLPEYIMKKNINKNRYICMIPSEEFQIKQYAKREWAKSYLTGCSDPKKAFDNWMKRDIKYAKIVRKQTQDFGFNLIVTDGSRSIEETFRIVCDMFDLTYIKS